MNCKVVYFKTKVEAEAHYKYCNPSGGRPDISSGPVFEVTDKNGKLWYALNVSTWSLD